MFLSHPLSDAVKTQTNCPVDEACKDGRITDPCNEACHLTMPTFDGQTRRVSNYKPQASLICDYSATYPRNVTPGKAKTMIRLSHHVSA